MPRNYLRLMPDFFERKAAGTERRPPYPPAAISALVGVFCLAEQQPERGRFKSRRLLQVLLEETGGKAYAKHVPFLLQQEDLVELADGTVYVDGWDELQEGNYTPPERMQRFRQRHSETVTRSPEAERVARWRAKQRDASQGALQEPLQEASSNGVTGGVTGSRARVAGGEAVSGKRLAGGGTAASQERDAFDDGGGFEDLDPGFRERYGELVAALGKQVDQRLAMEFQQIAEDHDAEAIRAAIRACMAENKPTYPSYIRPHLPRLQPENGGGGIEAWQLFENLDDEGES